MTIGIYKIEALCPGARMARQAIYIGQSKNIERRWKQHHKRFPPDQYSYEVLLAVPPEHDIDLLERLFIEVYDSHRNGLNKTIGGTNIKTRYPDAETRAKIGEAHRGRHHTEETKAKISEVRKGKYHTKESKARMSEAKRGKLLSEEHKAKLSEAKKGKPKSEEHKANMREGWQRKREREAQ